MLRHAEAPARWRRPKVAHPSSASDSAPQARREPWLRLGLANPNPNEPAGSEGDFLSEVAENEEVRFYVHQIHAHIRANEEECNLFREPFIAHRDLWTVDIGASLAKFLASGPDYHQAEAEGGRQSPAAAAADQMEPAAAAAADTARARLRREPPLYAFDEKIAYYKGLQDAVALMPVSATCGWLKVDANPNLNPHPNLNPNPNFNPSPSPSPSPSSSPDP